VITGVYLRSGPPSAAADLANNVPAREIHTGFQDQTLVWFAALDQREINYYINTYKPFDKAGSYGVQEWLGYIGIEQIQGSYFNVMGFPVHKLWQQLRRLDVISFP
jgi:septum formation protein